MWCYLAATIQWGYIPLYITNDRKLTESQGKTNPTGILLNSTFFSYFAKNTHVLGSGVRNALFMHQLSYRQETLWSPSWEQSLSLSPVCMVRQVGSRFRAEAEGTSLFVYMQECLPELGVVGELAWLFCTAAAAACAAFTAVLAAYRLASSWNLPIFFLYRILLLPNQLDTCVVEQKEEEQRSQTSSSHSTVHWAVWLFQDVMFGSIKYPIPSPCSNVRRVHKLIKP